MGPCDAGAAARRDYRLATGEPPLHPGKIEPCRARERNPCPWPWIGVEQLVTAVAHVILEFEFDQAGKPDRGEKPVGRPFDGRLLDRFHECAGDAELDGVLARPPRHQRGDGGSPAPHRRVGELDFAAAGNQLLDGDFIGADERRGLFITRQQGGAIVDAPRLRGRERIAAGMNSRLENDRKPAVESGDFVAVSRVAAPGRIDADGAGVLVQ